MKSTLVRAARLAVAAGILTSPLSAQDWSRFRGPNGSGISTESGFPTVFEAAVNGLWRTPVRPGKSSPVLSRRHVFLVGFEDGKFYTQCFDRATGRLLWERAEPRPRRAPEHRYNEPDVFFKDIGLISYDAEGRRRWEVPLGPFSNHMGVATSPILADGLLILQIDQSAGSFLAAYSPETGREVWRASRPEGDSWATPLRADLGGRPVLLTAGGGWFGAHGLRDGSRLWSEPGMGPAVVASPVIASGTVFGFGYGYEAPVPFGPTLEKYDASGDGELSAEEFDEDAWLQVSKELGDGKPPVTSDEWDAAFRRISTPSAILAVRVQPDPSAGGAVGSRVLWRVERSMIGVVPSPLVLDRIVYIVRNGGILTSFDAETGEQLKMGRLAPALGSYSASPVAAGGRLYFASEDGQMTVVKAGRTWEILAMSDLGEPIYATPALSAGRVFLRAGAHLYAFGSETRRTEHHERP